MFFSFILFKNNFVDHALPGKILFDAESVFQSIVNDVANSGGNNRWDCTLRGELHVNLRFVFVAIKRC